MEFDKRCELGSMQASSSGHGSYCTIPAHAANPHKCGDRINALAMVHAGRLSALELVTSLSDSEAESSVTERY